ncbi:MAG: ComEC/Rec2 family competence protein [Clostridia bacterium]|nr:ComEC/Rec2 family competence protein [Clostridia bacterium]
MSRKQFFAFSFGVFASAAAGVIFNFGGLAAGITVFASLAAWCVLFALLRENREKRSAAGCFLLGVGAMAVYFALYTGVLSGMAEKYNGFSGEITLEAADYMDGGGTFEAKLVTDRGASPYLVRLSNYADPQAPITPGSRFKARVSLSAPENTPRFSSQRYYRAERIYLTGYVSDISDFSPEGVNIQNWHKYLRNASLERTDLLYGEKAYLMKGLLFGDKSDFTESFSLDASNAGVSHVFAVSGMHLSFLVSAVLLLSRRRTVRYFAIAVVLVFMAVTGFEPSVVRAGIMQISALFAWVRGRESESFGSMAFSLLVLLAFNPCSIGDIGLQFSFCAVAGILIWSEKLNSALFTLFGKLPSFTARPARLVVPAVAVSLSATLFTVPCAVMYFERLSLVSVITNIAVNWLVSPVFVAGIISLILSCIWLPLGEGLAWVNSWGAEALELLIRVFANVPFAVLGAESPFVKAALAATYGFGGFCVYKKVRGAVFRTAAVFAGGICAALCLSYLLSFCGMRITAVDSASECTLISADGRNYAVGVGGEKLGELLQNRNAGKLDLLIIPFIYEKDVSCAEELISAGRVRRLALAGYSGKREHAERLLSAARSKGIPADVITSDREYLSGDVRFSVLVPASGGDQRGACAVLLEYKGASAFIVGNVSPKAQERLIKTRELPKTQLLLLSGGGGRSRCSPETLGLCENGLVLVSGRGRAEADGLSDKDPLFTSGCGNLDVLFFRGKIYTYN